MYKLSACDWMEQSEMQKGILIPVWFAYHYPAWNDRTVAAAVVVVGASGGGGGDTDRRANREGKI